MKSQSLIVVLVLIFCSFSVSGQDFMDALKQTAEMHNESRGLENNENNRSLTPQEQQRLGAFWEDKIKNSMDFINGLNKPHHQCMALIGLFRYELQNLEKATEEERNCKMKYDLLGMQLLMHIGGTTLMPCTEELWNYRGDEDIFIGFWTSLEKCEGPNSQNWTSLAEKAPVTVSKIYYGYFEPSACYGSYPEDLEEHLIMALKYFHPGMLVNRILEIGQEMEALGCGN